MSETLLTSTSVPTMRLQRYVRSGRVEEDCPLPSLTAELPEVQLIELRQWDVVRRLPRHAHDDVFHLDHFLEGEGTYMIGNRLNAIDRQTFYFIPPKVPHQLNASDGSALAHLSIKFRYTGLQPSFLPATLVPDPEIGERARRRLRELAELLFDDERETMLASLMLAEALVDLHRAAVQTQDTAGEHRLVVAARHFMEEHFASRLSLEDIAGAAGVGGPHLCRVFKKETGQTPFEFLRQVRLDCAKYWLSQTAEKLADIAVYTGFGSSQEMNRAFRKLEDMSPREFRKVASANGSGSEEE